MISGTKIRIGEPVASYLLNLLRNELSARAPDSGAGDESPGSEMMRAAVNDLANGLQIAKNEAAILAENDDKRAADEEERRARPSPARAWYNAAARELAVQSGIFVPDESDVSIPSAAKYKGNVCDQQGRCWHRCDTPTCSGRCSFLFEPEERDLLRNDTSVESAMIPHPHECFRCLNRRTNQGV